MQSSFRSRYVDVGGRPVHVADFGGDGPPVVLVHGLGGAHVNWISIADRLSRLGRVTAIDLPGFGLTVPAGGSCSLSAAQSVLGAYLRTCDAPALVVGNSMGAVVGLMEAAASPETMRGLALVSPAVPLLPRSELDPWVAMLFSLYLAPGAGRLVLRGRRRVQGPEEIARFTLDLCAARPARIEPDIVRAHIQLGERRAQLPGMDGGFLEAARSLLGFLVRSERFDRLVAGITVPTLMIHGRDDRLMKVPWVSRVASMRPDWRFELLDDVGHVPMLEVPATTASLVGDWAALTAAA